MNDNQMNYQPQLITAPVTAANVSPVGNNIYTDLSDGVVEIDVVDDGRGGLIRLWSEHGLPIDIKNGKKYRLKIDVRQTVGFTGNERVQWWGTKEWHQISEIWATHQFNFVGNTHHADHYIRFSLNGGDKIEFRNILLQEVPEC